MKYKAWLICSRVAVTVSLAASVIVLGCTSVDSVTSSQAAVPMSESMNCHDALEIVMDYARKHVDDFEKYRLESSGFRNNQWSFYFAHTSDITFGWPGTFVVTLQPDHEPEIVRLNY